MFIPYLGKMVSHFDDHIFSEGLVQPRTRYIQYIENTGDMEELFKSFGRMRVFSQPKKTSQEVPR